MDTFDIVILTIIICGILLAVFIFFQEPVNNIKFFLNLMRSGSLGCGMIFLPIWFPIWIIDKIFKLNIFEKIELFNSSDDDLIYASKRDENIYFDDYEKFLNVNSKELKLINSKLEEFIDTYENKNIDYWYSKVDKEYIVLKNNSIGFYDYINLIQWLETYENNQSQNLKISGILKNNKNLEKSFFVENDKTGKHINSLIGKTFNNETFSIYIIDDFSKGAFISFNDSIKVDTKFDFTKSFINFEKMNFEKIIIQTPSA